MEAGLDGSLGVKVAAVLIDPGADSPIALYAITRTVYLQYWKSQRLQVVPPDKNHSECGLSQKGDVGVGATIVTMLHHTPFLN